MKKKGVALDLKEGLVYIYTLALGAIYVALLFYAIKKYGFDYSNIDFYLFFLFSLFFEFIPVRFQTFFENKFDEKYKEHDLYLSAGLIVSVLSAIHLNISNALVIPFLVFLILRSKVLFSKNYYYFIFNVSSIGILIFLSFKVYNVFPNVVKNNLIFSSFVVALISIFYFVLNLSFVLSFLTLVYRQFSKDVIFKLIGEGRLTNLFSTSINTFIVYILYKFIGISAIPVSFFTVIGIQLGNYYATKYRQAKLDLLTALAKSLEEKDSYTFGHGENVAKISVAIAKELGIQVNELNLIEIAGLLHDVGKIGIPDFIVTKTGKLTRDEYEIMKEHPKKGYEILSQITEFKDTVAKWVLHHHERWDGKGYPEGISGEEIPLESRILMIADVYHALTSDRPYREAWSKEQAIGFIKDNAGIMFDPEIVNIFLKLIEGGSI
ncbi:HD-GYP domain-containing protein [Thermosipho sp. (in: thermotogales)]|uniref:HD-GYP domain-containing protein n=1 Tax=Thermosipho sp. (in: thermotogales) TaxID=1968895 RepID=UPI00257E38FB|nr:HD-GYP domain-containing protein [Thermosipho sp. (in: thermotogales)]